MKKQKGFTTAELISVVVILFIILVGGIGWIRNIVKLTDCNFEAPYKAEVIRVIGIFPPVGAVIGWIDIKD